MQAARAALAAQSLLTEDMALGRLEGQVIDLDDIAVRRERLLAYADETAAVIVYRFVFPPGASVASLGRGQEHRDAADQLQLLVGLTGGGVTHSHGGLAARIPKVLAARFEAMAAPLVADWLVALDLGEGAP